MSRIEVTFLGRMARAAAGVNLFILAINGQI